MERNGRALDYLIWRSLEIKAEVVSKDEKESGLREILNFGHTFGHALESSTNYKRYQHGEAVAWGMIAASLLGHKMRLTPARDVSRIVALIRRMGSLPDWPQVSPDRLIEAMRSDKKSRGGKLRFVLSPGIGRAATYETIPVSALRHALHFAPALASDGGIARG
jgi:3-dehydroquinate synthase